MLQVQMGTLLPYSVFDHRFQQALGRLFKHESAVNEQNGFEGI